MGNQAEEHAVYMWFMPAWASRSAGNRWARASELRASSNQRVHGDRWEEVLVKENSKEKNKKEPGCFYYLKFSNLREFARLELPGFLINLKKMKILSILDLCFCN